MTHEFVVLDTDVASLSFKQQLPPSLLAQLIGAQPCITFVTLGELTKWAEMRRWGRRTRAELDRWLGLAVLLPYDREVATVWGELQAEGAHRGRTPPQNDTRIAACCLVEDLSLATRNVKDYAPSSSTTAWCSLPSRAVRTPRRPMGLLPLVTGASSCALAAGWRGIFLLVRR